MAASSALVIRTLTSGADLMKSSASRPSLKALTSWPSFSRSRDTAFKIVRLGSTTTMRTVACPRKRRHRTGRVIIRYLQPGGDSGGNGADAGVVQRGCARTAGLAVV